MRSGEFTAAAQISLKVNNDDYLLSLGASVFKNSPQNNQVKIELTKGAYEYLADKAYDPLYGARPLKRVISHKIENPLARKIISGELKSGSVLKFTEADLKEG